MKKTETNTNSLAAVIHIGSNAVRLRIAQTTKGGITDLERLVYPLAIGHEVFRTHNISFRTLRELSRVLTGFMTLVREYGVTDVRTVAASAFRDAHNRALVIDRLKIQNEIDVEVLENSVEKTLIYYKIAQSLEEARLNISNNALFAFVGSGTVGLASTYTGRVEHSQNLPIGALKLNDMLAGLKEQTENFSDVMEEYLDTLIKTEYKNVKHLVLAGSSVTLAAKLTGAEDKGGVWRADAAKILALFERVRKKRAYAIADEFGIAEDAAELLYAVLAIYVVLIKRTSAAEVFLPRASLIDGIMDQMLIAGRKKNYREHVRLNALTQAHRAAHAYGGRERRIDFMLKTADIFFDKLKKLHGLGAGERLALEIAAILHDCGRIVSARSHLSAAHDIIRQSEIYGMTFRQRQLAANIVRYDEFTAPDFDDEGYAALSGKEQTKIAKLAAIFRLIKSLDISGRQKIESLSVSVKENEVTVTAETDENIALEEWAFKECAAFFKMVFGLSPVLKRKKRSL